MKKLFVLMLCALLFNTGCNNKSVPAAEGTTQTAVLSTTAAAPSPSSGPTATPERVGPIVLEGDPSNYGVDAACREALSHPCFESMIPWNFGVFAAALGDLNGDGTDDIALCARKAYGLDDADTMPKDGYLAVVAWGMPDGSFGLAASSASLNIREYCIDSSVFDGIFVQDGALEVRRELLGGATGQNLYVYSSIVRFVYSPEEEALLLDTEETIFYPEDTPFYASYRLQTTENFGKVRFNEYDNMPREADGRALSAGVTAYVPEIPFTDGEKQRAMNAIIDEDLAFCADKLGAGRKAVIRCTVAWQDAESLSLHYGAYETHDDDELLVFECTTTLDMHTITRLLAGDIYPAKELAEALLAFQRDYPQFSYHMEDAVAMTHDALLLAASQTDDRADNNGSLYSFDYLDSLSGEKKLGVLAPMKDAETLAKEKAENTVQVSNAQELVNAIAPNKHIIMKEGVYDITGVKPDAGSPGFAYTYGGYSDITYDGQLTIEGVWNLTIEGEGNVHIVTKDAYANVLAFSVCEDITLRNITLGHDVEPGYCTGGVVIFTNSRGLTIEGCTLYGCGTIGLDTYGSYGARVLGSTITGCSGSAISASWGGVILVSGSDIIGNGYWSALFVGFYCPGLRLERCVISDNVASADAMRYMGIGKLAKVWDSRIVIKDCDIARNQVQPLEELSEGISLEGCRLDDNGPGTQPRPASSPAPPPTGTLAVRESPFESGTLRVELRGERDEQKRLLVNEIRVAGPEGFSQTIALEGGDRAELYDTEYMFVIEDMNFDGAPDFRVLWGSGAGSNMWFHAWVWDEGAGLFIRDNAISAVVSPEFFPEMCLIMSSVSDGAAYRITSLYTYADGLYEFFRREDIYDVKSNQEFIVQSVRKGGEWMELSRELSPEWNPQMPDDLDSALAISPPAKDPIATRVGVFDLKPVRVDAYGNATDGRIDTLTVSGEDGIWQTIKLDEPSPVHDDDGRYFILEDMNFDEYPDLRLVSNFPSNYERYYCWLWDPSAGQFIRNVELEELLGIEVRPEGLIFSHNKESASVYSSSAYVWINETPRLIYKVRRDYTDFRSVTDYLVP